jgi:hypothetical protein
MTQVAILRECRRPTRQAWVGATLVVALLLAECFAVTHPVDAAAHDDGQPCTVCLSTTTLGAGAVATPIHFGLDAATPVFVATFVAALVSTVPTRRFARGPPAVSFAF